MPDPAPLPPRLLVHTKVGQRIPIDPADIFFLEAHRGGTRIRLAPRRPLIDISRPLTDLLTRLDPTLFLHIHRNHAVNLLRIAEVRRRRGKARGWEVKLEAPVGAVLPVSRDSLSDLWKAFAE